MSDPSQEVRDPMLGRALGRFTLRARLGAGAIGSVYRADDASTGGTVALKILLPDLAKNAQAVKRLQREAAFARKIAHPNVVRVLDVGDEAGVAFVAMELIAGRSLEELIAREGALVPERAARITLGILSALIEAHAHGIVHRDLKPANVMLEGEGEQAKLVDFGVARVLDDEALAAPLTRLTRDGFTVGTPAYMAPEQFGSAAVGPEADLYSVGLVLHEMLAGTPAFVGTLREVVVKQMTALPAALPEYGGLGPLVRRLTAKEVKDRPASAVIVHAELAELIAGWQRTAVVVPASASASAPVSAPIEPVAAVAEGPTRIIGMPPALRLHEPDTAQATAAVVPDAGGGAGPWAVIGLAVVVIGGAAAWVMTRPPQVTAPPVGVMEVAPRASVVASPSAAVVASPSAAVVASSSLASPSVVASPSLASPAPASAPPASAPPASAPPASAPPASAPPASAPPVSPRPLASADAEPSRAARTPARATARPSPPRPRADAAARRRPDPCRATPTNETVKACLDRVDAAVRTQLPPGDARWARYTKLWDRVDTAQTAADRARLLDDLATFARDLERPD